MTKETAAKAKHYLEQIDGCDKILTFLERQDAVWFGLKTGEQYAPMPTECISGAQRSYRKLKEYAEAELEKL